MKNSCRAGGELYHANRGVAEPQTNVYLICSPFSGTLSVHEVVMRGVLCVPPSTRLLMAGNKLKTSLPMVFSYYCNTNM